QSYTYFTWRNTKAEFTAYMSELMKPPVSEFYRPNFWPNTPDILPEHLQFGGRQTFVQRLLLAATLSSNYGIYGPAFALMEPVARFQWRGARNYVELNPHVMPASIFRIRRKIRSEHDFEYFL